ncbi:AbrB family transcriptional regulator [Acrocarpospora pleiomorpha]|uniref:AbrB family transcriptional regulator n=1 Tax=Acrocarpospora pleiomorpha TaxID=90975 RepID=A0A5M3XGN6_9ACTN|nr:AbrB family transcriptional regulator [Acrocarpospora pleiomorpha]GES20715.1 AbrB family transcriptional regulator [Acrocarpospora pleiomorpha]
MRAVRWWGGLVALVVVGNLAMTAAGVPSAPLFAGLIAGVVVGLRAPGVVRMPRPMFRCGQAIIGVTTGLMIDWNRLGELGWGWPAVVLVCVATLASSVGAGQLLRRHGVSRATATFASVAGGASGVTAIASDYGADDRVVVVVQYTRVLIILLTLPLMVSWLSSEGSAVAVNAADPTTGLSLLGSVLAIGVGLGGGRLLRLPSPAVLGGLLAGAAVAAVPVFHDVAMPPAIRLAGFVLIGTQVGLRFNPDALRLIRSMMPTVFVVIALVIGSCVLLALGLAAVTGVDHFDAYLATTPGGFPAVLAAATSSGADITLVSAVQLMRLLLVLFLTPLLARWLLR